MNSDHSGRARRWTRGGERVLNVALVVAAVALTGALVKRHLSANTGTPATQAVRALNAPEVVLPSPGNAPASPNAPAAAAKTTVNKPTSGIDDKAESVSEQQLEDAVRAGQRLVVLDVRERRDFAGKHFPRAKNMPVDEIEVRAVNELSPADLIVLFCGCKNDEMSKVAQKILTRQGFTRTTFLHNGTETCGYCR